ncbi:MAG: NADH-quinone oxidoreductase subunit J [Burkholderiales bacterium]|nr:NADH-quinone oxidoreductase subunit J [Burkholderiales bacterium]
MMIETLVFYFFSAVLILSSLAVITARNPVHSALFLVLAFFTAAGLWLLLEAEFLAIVLVLVYVGAVMVLFLFVVMMLDINIPKLREGIWAWLPFGALLAIVMVVEMWIVLGSERFGLAGVIAPEGHPVGYSNTKELGRLIYTQYVYPFEIAAVILLVAIVSAIALTLRRRKETKSQLASEQLAAHRQGRVRLVSMKRAD